MTKPLHSTLLGPCPLENNGSSSGRTKRDLKTLPLGFLQGQGWRTGARQGCSIWIKWHGVHWGWPFRLRGKWLKKIFPKTSLVSRPENIWERGCWKAQISRREITAPLEDLVSCQCISHLCHSHSLSTEPPWSPSKYGEFPAPRHQHCRERVWRKKDQNWILKNVWVQGVGSREETVKWGL